MSIEWLSYVFKLGPTQATDRLVLLALADFADAEGNCYPSVSTLVDRTSLSRRSVFYALERLSTAGWIEVRSGKGRRQTNQYRIKKVQPVYQDDLCNSASGAPMQPEMVQDLHVNGATIAHSPSQNRQTTDDDKRRVRNSATPCRAELDPEDLERVLMAMGVDAVSGPTGLNGRKIPGISNVHHLQRWRFDLRLTIDDIETVIAEVMSRKPGSDPPFSFKYFDRSMQHFAAMKHSPKLNSLNGGRTGGKSTKQPCKSERRLAAFIGRSKRA